MDPSPKTIELLHYAGQWNLELTGSCYSTVLKTYFLSMPQLSKYGASKLKILGADRISILQFCDRLRRGYKLSFMSPIWGKKSPLWEILSPLLGIIKPAEGLNKPCQGNVNGRKSFAAEGFDVKMPFISQTYTKAVANFPSDKVILEFVILLSITQGSFLRNLSMRWLALMRRCAEFKVIAQAYWRYTQRFELFKR